MWPAGKLEVVIPDAIQIQAGTITEEDDRNVIAPPETPLIDQLIAYLDTVSYHFSDIQTRHLAIGLTALCVRWGSYLATLTDASSEPHPALAAPSHVHQSQHFSMITDWEMMRMNIEVSYGIARLARLYRERGLFDFYDLLGKAYHFLPMPQKAVTKNMDATYRIYGSLHSGNETIGGVRPSRRRKHMSPQRPLIEVATEDADRYLANLLACHSWRNTEIENIHAGRMPEPRLTPHQQRLTKREEQRVMREVTANFGAVLFTWEELFDTSPRIEQLPTWPNTARALANSSYGIWASPDWSLVDSSSEVILFK